METGYTADRMHRRAIERVSRCGWVNRHYFRHKNKCLATLDIVTAKTKMNRYTLRLQRVNLTRVSDIAPGRMECSFEPEDEFGNDE